MYSDTQPVTVRQVAAPLGHVADFLRDCGEAPGIDRMLAKLMSVVPVLRGVICRIDLAGRADQLEQMLFRVLAFDVRQFIDKAAGTEGVKYIAHRP